MILCGGSDPGELKTPEHDFKYLYWTISKTLFGNPFTCKGTYMTDWVGRTAAMSSMARGYNMPRALISTWAIQGYFQMMIYIKYVICIALDEWGDTCFNHVTHALITWHMLQSRDTSPVRLCDITHRVLHILCISSFENTLKWPT